MHQRSGFWSGMSPKVRARFFIGAAYLGFAMAVLSQTPILGIVLLMLPILWTVLVIWTGSEDGMSFGPYRRTKDTAFGYTLRYLWQASGLGQAVFAIALIAACVGGLGWLSTAKMRAVAEEPTFTERVTTAADNAAQATKETTSGWVSTAKGWFSRGETEE
ncbi:MAG: hypothetical protein AAGK71_02235 [Pseudomonadota bacterium]